jgi:hypothetical protein
VPSNPHSFDVSFTVCSRLSTLPLHNGYSYTYRGQELLDLADPRFKGLKGPIDADLMWEVFCGIPEGIDRYLVLRELLKVAPKVYYQLLLRHTESILPFIYTVSA